MIQNNIQIVLSFRILKRNVLNMLCYCCFCTELKQGLCGFRIEMLLVSIDTILSNNRGQKSHVYFKLKTITFMQKTLQFQIWVEFLIR